MPNLDTPGARRAPFAASRSRGVGLYRAATLPALTPLMYVSDILGVRAHLRFYRLESAMDTGCCRMRYSRRFG